MSTSRYRWWNEHGHKILHRRRIAAWWHAFQLNMKFSGISPHDNLPTGGKAWQTYPCRWAKHHRDGETAKRHWHVGRPPGK